MKHNLTRLFAIAALVGAVQMAGCSHSSTSVMPATPQQAGSTPNLPAPDISPDFCNKNVTQNINAAGGAIKIPACGGTTGSITYGANNAPSGTTATLLAATSNPNPSACGTPSGETVVAYFTALVKSSSPFITFGTTTVKSHIGNPAFMSSSTFTIFAYAFGSQQFSKPLGHPNSHGVLTFASPLNGQTIPQNVLVCFELATP